MKKDIPKLKSFIDIEKEEYENEIAARVGQK